MKKEKEKEKEKSKKALKDEANKKPAVEIVEEDPEVVKLREAERMAALLLEEEERERSLRKVGGKGSKK